MDRFETITETSDKAVILLYVVLCSVLAGLYAVFLFLGLIIGQREYIFVVGIKMHDFYFCSLLQKGVRN